MGGRFRCGALVCGALLPTACGDDLDRVPEARLWCTAPVSHPSVQAALDDPLCQTVWIEAGLYDENLVIERSAVLEARGEVVIDGGARGSVVVIDGTEVAVTFRGLVIQNGLAERGGGIEQLSSAGIILYGTTVRDNQATIVGGGISANDRVELRAGSVVERNRVVGAEPAVAAASTPNRSGCARAVGSATIDWSAQSPLQAESAPREFSSWRAAR